MATTKKAALRLIAPPPSASAAAPAVCLSVPSNCRKYTAGQWVFLCIPQLGLLHWHPFTISSSGLDANLTLHFAAAGQWTSRVAALADTSAPVKVRGLLGQLAPAPAVAQAQALSSWCPAKQLSVAVAAQSLCGYCRLPCAQRVAESVRELRAAIGSEGHAGIPSHCPCDALQAYIEGPYGSPMLDAFGTTHTAFLVISSGFGWTFLRAWKRQLVQARFYLFVAFCCFCVLLLGIHCCSCAC